MILVLKSNWCCPIISGWKSPSIRVCFIGVPKTCIHRSTFSWWILQDHGLFGPANRRGIPPSCPSPVTPEFKRPAQNVTAGRYGGHLRPYLSVTCDPTPLKPETRSLATLPLFTAPTHKATPGHLRPYPPLQGKTLPGHLRPYLHK